MSRWSLPAGKRRLHCVLLALPVFALVACGNADDAYEAGGNGDGVAVTWTEAETRAVEITQRALGTVRARTDPRVAAEVAGRIEALHVDEGSFVDGGDLLAEIESEDYEIALDRAETDIRRLGARIRVQEATVARNQALGESEYVSVQELDEAEAELDALREELAGARLSRRTAERDLDRTRIKAPFAGQIDERMVSEGDYAQPGEPLFHLSTAAALKVHIGFPEALAVSLESGMPLNLHNRSAHESDLAAEITEVRPVISEGGRAVRVIAAIDNPGGWRPGASVNAEVVITTRESITLPAQAVVRRPDGSTVYILDDDREAVEARLVETGRRTADWVEIREGVEAGEAVAVDGAGFLTDGAAISASMHDGAENGE